jgi:hypothetical protein
MKTLKCVLLAALFAVAMIGSAVADEAPKAKAKKVVSGYIVQIAFQNAIQNPDLLNAMNAQLDRSLINDDKPVYVARVCYAHRLYLISGTQDQWKRFFNMHFRARIVPVLDLRTD